MRNMRVQNKQLKLLVVLCLAISSKTLRGEEVEKPEKSQESTDDSGLGKGREIVSFESAEKILESPEEYSYAAFDSDDPFDPPVVNIEVNAIGQKNDPILSSTSVEIAIKSPLQTELKKLKIAGVWRKGSGDRKALIMAPELGHNARKIGVVAEVGDPMGIAGKIIAIEDDYVIVREFKFEKDGTRTASDTTMYIDPPNQNNMNKVIRFTDGKYSISEKDTKGNKIYGKTEQETAAQGFVETIERLVKATEISSSPRTRPTPKPTPRNNVGKPAASNDSISSDINTPASGGEW